MSCYEAGREGFWLHRCLLSLGIENHVVDAASIEVNRRLRRAKTDRMDASRLLGLLVRFAEGERSVWSVVHAPSPEEEDRRHLHRELLTAKRDRTRLANRIQGLLANQGVRAAWRMPLPAQLSTEDASSTGFTEEELLYPLPAAPSFVLPSPFAPYEVGSNTEGGRASATGIQPK